MRIIKVLCALSCVLPLTSMADSYSLTSPNKRVQIDVENDHAGLHYSISLDGNAITTQSSMGLIIDTESLGNSEMLFVDKQTSRVRESIELVTGKAKQVDDHYNAMTLKFKSKDERALALNLMVRAYDEGVAFRYVLPEQEGLNTFTIQNELTRFDFASDYQCYGLNLGKFSNSHEGEFDLIKASQIREHSLYDNPLVCKTGVEQTTFALAESDVRDYAGAWFTGRADGGVGVTIKLTPRFDSRKDGLEPVAVKATMTDNGVKSPWRVMMLGDNPGQLTASSLIPILGEPNQLSSTDWIKPGKTAWDWWNDNRVVLSDAAKKAGVTPGMNTDTYLAYIDFAATLGLEFILIDAGWHEGAAWTNSPGSDVLKPIPEMDMPKILAYAKSKNVDVWVWLQWKQLDWQMKEVRNTMMPIAQYHSSRSLFCLSVDLSKI